MKISKLLGNQGSMLLNTMIAASVGAIAIAGQQMQQQMQRLQSKSDESLVVLTEELRERDTLSTVVAGATINASSPPVTFNVPVPPSLTGEVNSIQAFFTGPNSDLDPQRVIATYRLKADLKNGRSVISTRAALIFRDSSGVATQAREFGGIKQEAESCASVGGQWDGATGCLLRGPRIEAPYEAYAAFMMDSAIVQMLNAYNASITQDYVSDVTVALGEISAALNSSPSIDNATKTQINNSINTLAGRVTAHANLRTAVQGIDVPAQQFIFNVASKRFWDKQGSTGSTIRLNVGTNGEIVLSQQDQASTETSHNLFVNHLVTQSNGSP